MGAFSGRLQFDQFKEAIDPLFGLPPGNAKHAGVKAQQLFRRQKFVIIRQFRQIANPLAGNGFPDIDVEKANGSAGGVHEAKQNIHCGGLRQAPLGFSQASPVWTLRFSPSTASFTPWPMARLWYSTRKSLISTIGFIRTRS